MTRSAAKHGEVANWTPYGIEAPLPLLSLEDLPPTAAELPRLRAAA